MSWTCPYQVDNECIRLRKLCQPLQKGCVVDEKVTFIDTQLDFQHKKSLRREDDRNGKIRSNRRIQGRSQKG